MLPQPARYAHQSIQTAAGTGTLRAEMLNLDGLDTDAERNIISIAED